MNSFILKTSLWLGLIYLFISHAGVAGYTAVLNDPDYNKKYIVSDRLIGRPVSEQGFKDVEDALNHPVNPKVQEVLESIQALKKTEHNTVDGAFINGCLFGDGQIKPKGWHKKVSASKIERLQKGKLSWRLFYTKDPTPQFVAAIEGTLNPDGTLELCWIAHPHFQSKGYMTEAMNAFLKGDVLRLPFLSNPTGCHFTEMICTIHPDNKASQLFAQRVLGLKLDGSVYQTSDYITTDYKVDEGLQSYITQRLTFKATYEDFRKITENLKTFNTSWQEPPASQSETHLNQYASMADE
jgi:hypothetical protein